MSEPNPSAKPDPEAILRATSYFRRDFQSMAVKPNRGQHDAIRGSVFQPLSNHNGSGLGHLDRLPPELMRAVCLCFDVQTALNFSQASRGARQHIAGISEYRRLSKHALGSLWALYRTGLAPHTPIFALHEALTTEHCVVCHGFGGFIFLLAATRCCLQCVETAAIFQVAPLSILSQSSGVPLQQLRDTGPVLSGIYGTYAAFFRKPRKKFKYFVTARRALEVLQEHGDTTPRTTLSQFPDCTVWRSMACTMLPYFDPSTGVCDYGQSCRGCVVAYRNNGSDRNLERRERVYSREKFLVHFEGCEEAKRIWASRQAGTFEDRNLAWVVSNGLPVAYGGVTDAELRAQEAAQDAICDSSL